VPHTVLGDILSVGWGIAKREADPLFSQLFLCHCGLGCCLQEFYEFRIGCHVTEKLFSVRHSITFFLSPFLRNRDTHINA
jgi:hypothetical protein